MGKSNSKCNKPPTEKPNNKDAYILFNEKSWKKETLFKIGKVSGDIEKIDQNNKKNQRGKKWVIVLWGINVFPLLRNSSQSGAVEPQIHMMEAKKPIPPKWEVITKHGKEKTNPVEKCPLPVINSLKLYDNIDIITYVFNKKKKKIN